MQQASVGGELLRGVLVAGLKRSPHMGCMMPSVEGALENRLQRVSVELPE